MSTGPKIFAADGADAWLSPRSGFAPAAPVRQSAEWPFVSDRILTDGAPKRIGIVSNPRSHRNRGSEVKPLPVGAPLLFGAPASQIELRETLAQFAAAKVDLLIVDGGDGTVRDVITAASDYFDDGFPRLGVVPSGKTNALALDLGIPSRWTLQNAIEAAGTNNFKTRCPIEISGAAIGDAPVRGFLFGAGAFVRATEVAQRTHRVGAFNGIAVGLSLALGIGQTLFGSAGNPWRMGERMVVRAEDGRTADRDFYLLLGSTLERLPLGLKPFGHVRPGLKLLAVDAPPKALPLYVPPLLAGSERKALAKAGYHRGDPRSFELSVERGFILDGEMYPGGDLLVRTGTPLEFIVP